MTTYQITSENEASNADKEIVRKGLAAYNAAYIGHDNALPVNIFLRDETGTIVGGLLGTTYWNFLAIDIFWLDESVREKGFGEQMLKMAEQTAVQRGCTTAHLDTFEFQAPHFYEKYGYQQWGFLEGYAGKYKRIYYKKKLSNEETTLKNENFI